ncbi:MAG TPA: hypothetical protein VFG69_14745 [Nannocystaceae bacterium]|nr:hypothetical protein [Nannocystaceae bacterium]
MRASRFAILAALAGCSSNPAPDDGRPPPSTAADEPAAPDPDGPAPTKPATPDAPPVFGPIDRAARTATEDGIPILAIAVDEPATSGGITWIDKDALALGGLPDDEATDAESIYFVVDDDSSILVRGGEKHDGILRHYGIEKGGCAAARRGEVILSGVRKTGDARRPEQQIVVRIRPDGSEERLDVPYEMTSEEDCRAWLGDRGDFTLALSRFVHYDGKSFRELDSRGASWYPGRTTVGAPLGKRFCFRWCNDAEQAATDPLTGPLMDALGVRHTGTGEWAALGDWIAGATGAKAVRAGKDGNIETVTGLPESTMLNGSLDIVLTAKGDVVIGTKYRFAEYVVWPVGARKLSPVRRLRSGETMAHASPTMIVRGLGDPLPGGDQSAVVLGKPIAVMAGGSTWGFTELRSSPEAHEARMARAKAVLGRRGKLVAAHEAVVDLTCGDYVRSPLGWEKVQIHDWVPPKPPALHAKAVTKSPRCTKLDRVSALPGAPDLLFATSGDRLLAAWLPPPLPLPLGTGFHDRGPPPKPEKQRPRPGTGWFELGVADGIAGDDGIADPGGDTRIKGGWQAGGAAIITADGTSILVRPEGAVTLPNDTTPLAVGTSGTLHVWGAKGAKLVDCAKECRVIDTGVDADIVAVVPRSASILVLGFADGRLGLFTVPATGGTTVRQHALVPAIEAALKRRPVDGA